MIAVYALSNIDCPDDIYIGSSKNVVNRMKYHKSACNKVDGKKYNMKVYKFIRENGGFQKWQYHIIEEFDVYDKTKLKEREDYWMIELKSSLNSQRADHCKSDRNKEYYAKHRETELARKKKWNKENQARLSIKHFCECGGKYTFRHREEHFKTKKHIRYIISA